MTSTPREIGTLIVVVLRANHLPNKRHIGKQDPYCLVVVNGEKRRTKAIKRGGQHPEWDEEVRFTLFEDVDDVLARTANGDGIPPPPPPKDGKKPKNIKGGKTMKLACYADDPREPELIGETDVDLTEVLTKGETDEWFTLTHKDKFAGKVYLELTFWSNEPAPQKKATSKPPKNNKQYGGPGSFVPSGDLPPGSVSPGGSIYESHSRANSDVIPSSLRASSSAAHLDLYVAPYERNRNQQIDYLNQEFSELGVSAQKRRESYPPVPGSYAQAPQHSGTMHSQVNFPSYGYDQSAANGGGIYSYDRPLSPNEPTSAHHYQASSSSTHHGYPSQTYQPGYEVASPTTYPPPARGPRHSVPTSSSGFMPLTQSSSFVTLPSHTSEPSGFAPPPSLTPGPMGFGSQFQPHTQPAYQSPVSHTPALSNNSPYLQHSTSLTFPLNRLSIPPSASAPPQQFISSPPPRTPVPPQAAPAPPQLYQTLPPPHEVPPSAQHPVQMSHINGQSSRPLPPQPQIVYTQQPVQQLPVHEQPMQQPIQPLTTSQSLPPPSAMAQTLKSYSPTQTGNIYATTNGYSSVPLHPLRPSQIQSTTPIPSSTGPLPIPPPPPPPNLNAPLRRASLPQPPVTYHQQAQFQQPPPPPPPPPPVDYYTHGSLPPPPLLLDSRWSVDEHGQWIQTGHSHSQGQTSQAY
ncbi:hypothetical protein CPB84DRAFT_1758431 [Gymnopilus junonius]|uniref:C2 domain-containing protein n=1 Tax=Gymnopilus junonius TaxID=109634 RepID=A0A9P5P3G2_GYMJU|nr:hypothetical protein CPB84DRAFT_1758431 [Gymnopilus junonius]